MVKMLLRLVPLCALAVVAIAFEDNDLYGISHVGMTVRNLDVATRYYTEVLGAMLVEDLSTGDEGVYGDTHFYRMFQKEDLESQDVPDIRTQGTHDVSFMKHHFNSKLSFSHGYVIIETHLSSRSSFIAKYFQQVQE
jgi:hypothetical protein